MLLKQNIIIKPCKDMILSKNNKIKKTKFTLHFLKDCKIICTLPFINMNLAFIESIF